MTVSPVGWRKPSRSGQQSACVEIGRVGGGAAVRDTKNRTAGHLTTTGRQWYLFVDAVKNGKFDH